MPQEKSLQDLLVRAKFCSDTPPALKEPILTMKPVMADKPHRYCTKDADEPVLNAICYPWTGNSSYTKELFMWSTNISCCANNYTISTLYAACYVTVGTPTEKLPPHINWSISVWLLYPPGRTPPPQVHQRCHDILSMVLSHSHSQMHRMPLLPEN